MTTDAIVDFPESVAFTADNSSLEMGWEEAKENIQALVLLENDWDGEDASKICPLLIRSALYLAESERSKGRPAPHAVYPLPDGNIMLEWQHPDGIIERIEVEGFGRGELMVTYPNKKAEFTQHTWHAAGVASQKPLLGQKSFSCATTTLPYRDEDSDPSGYEFQLAA